MTTTVYDIVSKLITSDSRWSTTDGPIFAYVDDELGFDKIEVFQNHAFVFAGFLNVIENWKIWLRGGAEGPRPSVEGIALLIIDLGSGEVKASYGQDIFLHGELKTDVESIFSGSGSISAATCWVNNRCARRAVESAKLADLYSGGITRYYEMASGDHNLKNAITAPQLKASILERGMVMYLNANNPQAVPYPQAAANDVAVAELAKKILSGQSSLAAPCDAMFKKPTPEQESKLTEAISAIFQR